MFVFKSYSRHSWCLLVCVLFSSNCKGSAKQATAHEISPEIEVSPPASQRTTEEPGWDSHRDVSNRGSTIDYAQRRNQMVKKIRSSLFRIPGLGKVLGSMRYRKLNRHQTNSQMTNKDSKRKLNSNSNVNMLMKNPKKQRYEWTTMEMDNHEKKKDKNESIEGYTTTRNVDEKDKKRKYQNAIYKRFKFKTLSNYMSKAFVFKALKKIHFIKVTFLPVKTIVYPTTQDYHNKQIELSSLSSTPLTFTDRSYNGENSRSGISSGENTLSPHTRSFPDISERLSQFSSPLPSSSRSSSLLSSSSSSSPSSSSSLSPSTPAPSATSVPLSSPTFSLLSVATQSASLTSTLRSKQLSSSSSSSSLPLSQSSPLFRPSILPSSSSPSLMSSSSSSSSSSSVSSPSPSLQSLQLLAVSTSSPPSLPKLLEQNNIESTHAMALFSPESKMINETTDDPSDLIPLYSTTVKNDSESIFLSYTMSPDLTEPKTSSTFEKKPTSPTHPRRPQTIPTQTTHTTSLVQLLASPDLPHDKKTISVALTSKTISLQVEETITTSAMTAGDFTSESSPVSAMLNSTTENSIDVRVLSITSTSETNQDLSGLSQVQNITRMFESSVRVNQENDVVDVWLREYIKAYQHLVRLFENYGMVLRLASADIKDKLQFLQALELKNTNNDNYRSFESMFKYEFRTTIISTKEIESGVRENQIIHIGLHLYLNILKDLAKGDKSNFTMASVVRQHYDDILSPHHSYWVKAAARLVLNNFPSRETMLTLIGLPINQYGFEQTSKLSIAVERVFDKIETLYQRYFGPNWETEYAG